jgi:hypothetical protein
MIFAGKPKRDLAQEEINILREGGQRARRTT